ncbi:uncharacterized protein LOC115442310 [Manduca sexta]|uniref:uncharacterized protein LOC115442310 n=1 Tax=Manduca sexta TaxID=7130 RepID=UPI0018908DF5|nr:uncharacterized protein LOC115442310 [Manduca sexta]
MQDTEPDVSLIEDEVDPFENSIAEKMQMARNVVKHCERMHNGNIKQSSEIKSIINYTGVCEDTIIMADMSLRAAKTFTDWFQYKKRTKLNEYCFMLGSIRGMIVELYTKKMQVATKDKLMKGLFTKRCVRKRYDQSRVINDILQHGFMWKRVPGTKKTMLVERTDQYLKKMEYLTRMRAYRQAGRSIVYVNAFFYYYQLVVSPQHGLLHMGLHGLLHMGFHGLQKESSKYLEAWTKNVLIAAIPPNSVIVLKFEPQLEKVSPTPFTPKYDMIRWLSERNIPYDPTVHRADLYAIIKKFKQPRDVSAMEEILRSHGHDVVYRPHELKNLDYLEVMWPGIPVYRCKTDTIVKLREKNARRLAEVRGHIDK